MRDIGKNIRELRQRQNMTQDELAARLFVTRQTVSNYENGRTRPDVEQILRLAEIFGTDANAVLYGPPVPEGRKRAGIRTLAGVGLAAILWGVLALLRPWVTACAERNYQLLPALVLSAIWQPAVWGVTGWTLTQLLSLFIPIRPPQTLCVRRVRRGLLVLALCGITLPALDCILIYSAAYKGFPDIFKQILGWIAYFSLRSRYFYGFFGMALRLLGFPPERPAAPAPQEAPASQLPFS